MTAVARVPRLHQGLPGTAAARPGPRTLAADRQPADPPPRDLQLRRRDLTDGTTLKLCRLRYVGSARHWQFAIYRASHDDYDESVFPTGLPVGTCQDALDTACGLYLNDPTAWTQPPTNLRARPLRPPGAWHCPVGLVYRVFHGLILPVWRGAGI